MSLKRILKLLGAFYMSQGVSVVTQLLVPPIFLHRYPHGVEMYGEWIALTAAVSYVSKLQSGVQTYANNQMTLHYNRGEVQEFRVIQSSALRLLILNLALAFGAGAAILFMPIASWMGLQHISSAAAALTLFIIIVRLVAGWIFAFITNSYMMVGQLHRGTVWQNVQRLTATLALGTFLWLRASFPILALTQLASMVVFTVIVLVEMRFRAPILLPSLRYGNLKDLIGVLKPSAYYMLLALGGFLCWEGPVLLIQKILGPVEVALYAITRGVFNMSRQGVVILTQSIGQENIELIARRNWKQLGRMYDLSERLVLFADAGLTVGTLLACPLLFSVWLHKRGIYDPGMCMMMAVISAVIALRHHKFAYQRLSNRHQGVAKISVAAYGGMIVFTALALRAWGVDAFLGAWMVAELLICGYVIHENQLLFPKEFRPSLSPLPRFAVLLGVVFASVAWPVWHDGAWPLHWVAAMTAAAMAALLVLGYFLFGLREVQAIFASRLRRRFALRHL